MIQKLKKFREFSFLMLCHCVREVELREQMKWNAGKGRQPRQKCKKRKLYERGTKESFHCCHGNFGCRYGCGATTLMSSNYEKQEQQNGFPRWTRDNWPKPVLINIFLSHLLSPLKTNWKKSPNKQDWWRNSLINKWTTKDNQSNKLLLWLLLSRSRKVSPFSYYYTRINMKINIYRLFVERILSLIS